ncbi:mucin-13b [Clarias gariepinus]
MFSNSKQLEEVFKGNDEYLGSTVLKLEKGSIIADVQNFFSVKSNVNTTFVEGKLQEATNIPNGILTGAQSKVKDVCAIDYCDAQSTKCSPQNGLATCSCVDGYIQLTATQQACIPCPSGEQAVDSKTCKPCGFGYSGFNCQESYLLILVVVACVLGALLLGTLIGLAVMFSRSKKTSKNSEKNTPGGTLEFNKPVGITRIPRANPHSVSQPNSLEMTDSGSRYALVSSMWESDYNDDAKSFKNQAPSRTGYGARPTRNPYVDVYEDRNQRF